MQWRGGSIRTSSYLLSHVRRKQCSSPMADAAMVRSRVESKLSFVNSSRDLDDSHPESGLEEVRDTPLRVIEGTPWEGTADESNVPTSLDKIDLERRVGSRDRANPVEDIRRQKGIIHRAEQQRREPDAGKKANGARPRVVIRRAFEPMNRGRDNIIELPERACSLQPLTGEEVGETRELGDRLTPERLQEHLLIEAGETAADMAGRSLQIEGNRNSGCRMDLRWKSITLLAEILQHDVPAEGKTGQEECGE